MKVDAYRTLMKRRAALIEAAAQQDTATVAQAEIEAVHQDAAGKCEFCPDEPGECAVCNVFEAA